MRSALFVAPIFAAAVACADASPIATFGEQPLSVTAFAEDDQFLYFALGAYTMRVAKDEGTPEIMRTSSDDSHSTKKIIVDTGANELVLLENGGTIAAIPIQGGEARIIDEHGPRADLALDATHYY